MTKRKPKAKATAQRRAAKKPAATTKMSKQDRLIEMLQRPEGATIKQMADSFGWQPHTVRGTLSGALKKRLGLAVTSNKEESRGRVYRIAGAQGKSA